MNQTNPMNIITNIIAPMTSPESAPERIGFWILVRDAGHDHLIFRYSREGMMLCLEVILNRLFEAQTFPERIEVIDRKAAKRLFNFVFAPAPTPQPVASFDEPLLPFRHPDDVF